MSFGELTRKLEGMLGVKVGATAYRDVQWPGKATMPGTQEALNIDLWQASLTGNLSAVAEALHLGADVHAKDDSRKHWTAMHYAATGADPILVGCSDLNQVAESYSFVPFRRARLSLVRA